MRTMRWPWLLLAPVFLLGIAHVDRARGLSPGDWRTASREPVGLAPDPATTPAAVVQVYAARAVRWRGYFGVHTWIAVKPEGAARYTVYEVSAWQRRRSGTTVSVSDRAPDGRWFGNAPKLLAELRGPGTDEVIYRIDAAVRAYPYSDRYRVWPGPNSNTFTAFVLRAVPELRAALPATAIGKDYLGPRLVAAAPSGTGKQVSLLGVLGLTLAVEEGIEVNLLGMTFGIDPLGLGIKLPFAGDFALR
ncbi:MAG: DUF3750 domain-containing protein [Rhodocyclaceae bacterium]|nr:DUF3750 domain-containing protein [Rhodocyclaceae bacterium]